MSERSNRMESSSRYVPIDRYFLKKSGEVVILQSGPCVNKNACIFCTFHLDNLGLTSNAIERNKNTLSKVTGQTGVLRAYTSSSIFDLDEESLQILKQVTAQSGVRQLFCESHWHYRDKIQEFREWLSEGTQCDVVVRLGIETFDNQFRFTGMNKALGDLSVEQIRGYSNGINLLTGLRGQTLDGFKEDIGIARNLFDYVWLSIADPNYMCPNLVDFQLRYSVIDSVLKDGGFFWDFQPDLGGEKSPEFCNHRIAQRPLVMVYPSVRGEAIKSEGVFCDKNCEACYRNPNLKRAKATDEIV